jgi:hypothetical protein
MAIVVAQNGALQGAAQAVLSQKVQEGLTASGDYSVAATAANSFALQVSSSVGVITTKDHQVLLAMICAGALFGRPITIHNDTPGSTNPYYNLGQAIAVAYTAAVAKLLGSARAHDGSFQGAMFAALQGRNLEQLVASGDYTVLCNAAAAFAVEAATVVTAPTTDDTQAILAQICAGVLAGRDLTSVTSTDYLSLSNAVAAAYTSAVAKITGGSLSHYGSLQGATAAAFGGPAAIDGITTAADYNYLVNSADSYATVAAATIGNINSDTAPTAADEQAVIQGISAGALWGRALVQQTTENTATTSANPYFNLAAAVNEAYLVFQPFLTHV